MGPRLLRSGVALLLLAACFGRSAGLGLKVAALTRPRCLPLGPRGGALAYDDSSDYEEGDDDESYGSDEEEEAEEPYDDEGDEDRYSDQAYEEVGGAEGDGADDYEDEDYDDYEDEEFGDDFEAIAFSSVNKRKVKAGGSSGGSGGGVSAGALSARLLSSALSEVRGLTARAVHGSRSAVRGAKGFFSSDYEALLLAATGPGDDERPSEELVSRILGTVATFARSLAVEAESNPYRVTLRKLWAKAAEPDWRTALKAFFILHTLLREVEPEDGVIFKTVLNNLSRRPCRRTGEKCFSIAALAARGQPAVAREGARLRAHAGAAACSSPPGDSGGAGARGKGAKGKGAKGKAKRKGGAASALAVAVEDAEAEEDELVGPEKGWENDLLPEVVRLGRPLTSWEVDESVFWPYLEAYGAFVLKRFKTFTSDFEEMHLIGDGSTISTDDMVATLFKAKKLLSMAPLCEVHPDAECGLSLGCLALVAADARTLMRLFLDKLSWMERRRGSLFSGWADGDVEALLGSLTNFRDAQIPQIQDFLAASSPLLEIYGQPGESPMTGGQYGHGEAEDLDLEEPEGGYSEEGEDPPHGNRGYPPRAIGN